MIITITQCVNAIFNLSMHIMLNKINDSIIAKLPIFSHTVLKGLEHSSGMNRVSPAEHCKLRHFSFELK